MKIFLAGICSVLLLISDTGSKQYTGEIFDVHLHFSGDVETQIANLQKHNVKHVALSSAWDDQEKYRALSAPEFLIGLMFPCPGGIVPYSGQRCFSDGESYPDLKWVREQIINKKIDFLGEVLSEYYGISLSDSSLFPYYALAAEFNLPVGIHTGLAGPNHLSPNFDPAMGDPILLKEMLDSFPSLKVWLMHAGGPYLESTMTILKEYPNVYIDISVLSDPEIIDALDFEVAMKAFIEAGFEDRIMFGSDNGDLTKMINAVNKLDFLSQTQREKIFLTNAARFFSLSINTNGKMQ
ncbi:amidohydrolase family protein [Algoriphagus resistens]|uniref:amidohydrolase family protein n=1 Tax=Algoriphagus resistens TaxID=1750590 RepID=UPI000716C6A0|nr:amidohydrolase family protein [Algoriphagus resistens]